MLHILLVILKIIGIILAVLLGIIIVLLGVLLLVPVRYEVSAKCDGTLDTLKARAKITWLLHLVRADVFLKGKLLKWKVRVAWIKKSNAIVSDVKRKEVKKNEKVEEKDSPVQTHKEDSEVSDERSEETMEVCEGRRTNHPKETDRKEQTEKTVKESENEKKKGRKEKVRKEKSEKKKEKKKKNVGETLSGFVEKIKKVIQSLIGKVKDLLQKKEKVTDFLTDKAHVNAFKKSKKELFVLLKKLKPKKINIKVRYGFEDPCTTGQVLAGLSMLYPFLGDTTEVIPDFENQILKGTVYLKGRIRLCHFAVLAWRLFWCKDVRTSYKDIRNFKL